MKLEERMDAALRRSGVEFEGGEAKRLPLWMRFASPAAMFGLAALVEMRRGPAFGVVGAVLALAVTGLAIAGGRTSGWERRHRVLWLMIAAALSGLSAFVGVGLVLHWPTAVCVLLAGLLACYSAYMGQRRRRFMR